MCGPLGGSIMPPTDAPIAAPEAIDAAVAYHVDPPVKNPATAPTIVPTHWPVVLLMLYPFEAIDANDSAPPGIVDAVLADLTDQLPGMNHGRTGADGQVLRIAIETEQHDVTRQQAIGDAAQEGLVSQPSFQHAVGGRGGVVCTVAHWEAEREGDVRYQAGAVKAATDEPTLVPERRIERRTGRPDNVVDGNQFVPISPY